MKAEELLESLKKEVFYCHQNNTLLNQRIETLEGELKEAKEALDAVCAFYPELYKLTKVKAVLKPYPKL
jgi:hypothetical protein